MNIREEFREYLRESKLNETKPNASKENSIKKIINKINSEQVKEFASVFASLTKTSVLYPNLDPIFRKGKISITTKFNDFHNVVVFKSLTADSVEWYSTTPNTIYDRKMSIEDLYSNIKHIKQIYDIWGLNEYPEYKTFFKRIEDTYKEARSKKKDDSKIDKVSVVKELNTIFSRIGGTKSSRELNWSAESRDTARDAYSIANRKVPSQLWDYFEKNSYDSEDGKHDYNNDNRYFRTEKYKPKKEYESIIGDLIVGGYDIGDYSGDWAKSYIEIRLK